MSDYGMVVAWGTPVRGREHEAVEVFMEAQGFYQKAQDNGEIDSFETVLLSPTGGGLPGGHTILWAEPERLDELARADEFDRLVQRAGLVVDGIALARCLRGDALAAGMGEYASLVNALS